MKANHPAYRKDAGCRCRPAERERNSRGGGRQPRRRTAMVVERREAQRARSRRFAQADCSVARATPEAWAGGNIRPRGVAHDPGASRRSTRNARGFSCEWLFVNLALAKLGRAGVARTLVLIRHRDGGGGNSYSAAAFAARCGRRSRKCGRISSAIAVMLARAISFGMVPNWVLVSDVLKPARS
jgi:hypothetical protein